MTEHTTIHKTGGWTVELISPLDGIDKIVFQPVSLDHTIRWARKEIPSVLALMAELTGIKERVLRQISGGDSDRIFVAFSFIVPGTIKKDFDEGNRPLATPPELMTPEQHYEEVDSQVDPVDPRFPKVDGPVQRFKEPSAAESDGGIDVAAPDVMRKVG